jgi:hypothetical protein
MKRLKFAILLVLVAMLGFALGRVTGSRPVTELASIHKDFPLFPTPPKPVEVPKVDEEKMEKDVILETPVEDAVVSGAFVDVAGRAKVAGGALRVTVKDEAGTTLVDELVMIEATAGEEFGRFAKTFPLSGTVTGKGTVTVARSSGGGDGIVRTIHFGVGGEEVTLKAFFRNAEMSDGDDCSLVYPVERRASSKTAIYRAAIEELLKGPSAEEKSGGYATAVPTNATLKSVGANADGVVTADFSDGIERGVSGECRTSGIRAQIVATLRQFPEVRDVVITVNGDDEDVLTP